MCNRRNKPFCQVAILFALLGAVGYLFYENSLIKLDLEKSNSDVDKYFRQQESLSSQLQGEISGYLSRYTHLVLNLCCFIFMTLICTLRNSY